MDDQKLESLLEMLSWNYDDKDEQKKIISILADEVSGIQIKKLIQPMSKKYWLNSSKVIKQIDTNAIKEFSADLLVWLQDLNWPGAFNILNLFEKIDFENFSQGFYESIDLAIKEKDEIWVENLVELKNNNYLYSVLKGLIEYRYRDRKWEKEYIRIDFFDSEDISEFICQLYLCIIDCENIKINFRGYTPFCENKKLFDKSEDSNSFNLVINFSHLEVLEELKLIIKKHYDISNNYAWVREKLIYSLDELQYECKKYSNLFLETNKNS